MRKPKQPLYLDLAAYLRDGIVSQQWKAGDLLPSETMLSAEFGVSRGTVVKAIDVIVDEGLAQRRQGVGTFVARPALRRLPGFLRSFSEAVREQGRSTTHTLIDRMDLSRKDALQYGCDEPCVLLHRVRHVDGVPWAVHRSLVPLAVARKVPGLSGPGSRVTAPGFSLYGALEDAGLAIDHAEETLNGRLASAEEARLLNIDVPAAVMVVLRRSYDAGHRLLELIEAVYVADFYSYETKLVRTNDPIVLQDQAGLTPRTGE